MNECKINIIGAGVSGLSVGCYLQMQGYITEIFEKNSYSGGLCTSWQCGEYTFDGCIHWLMGSNDSNPFYQLWSELIDMNSIQFITHESRVDIEVKTHSDKYGNKMFHLYTSISRLEEYLLDIAPEDFQQIGNLISSMKQLQGFEIPPMIKSVPELLPLSQKIAFIKHLPLLFFMLKWKNITNYSFALKIKNPFLKEAMELLFDGDELPLLIMTLPLATNDKKGAGYPIGGSGKFAKKLEEKYLSSGGKINYNHIVEKIITENNTAKGLLFQDGKTVYSDLVISAADWNFTFYHALEGKYEDKAMKSLKQEKVFKPFYSAFLLSIGVADNLSDQSHFFRFPLIKTLISPDGTEYSRMEVHIMNYDPQLAPSGKTVVSVKFYTQNGQYWIDLRKNNLQLYQLEKQKFADNILSLLEQKIPGINKKTEVVDIATPATFYRYTCNWKGSTQSWLPATKNIMLRPEISFKIKRLKNFYYTSHWMQPGGGLPVAIKSARDLAQVICHDQKSSFVI